MRKINRTFIIFLIPLVFLTSCANSQTENEVRPEITGEIITDINNLMPAGKITVDNMDGIKENPRQTELTLKFQEGIKENYDWFVDYMKTVPNGEPMPYHKNLGLSKKEYKELQELMNDIELISTGKDVITIIKQGSVITFEAKDKLEILEVVNIDLDSNIVTVGEYTLMFSDTPNITDDKNGLRSKWKGYTWRYEFPSEVDFDALKDIENIRLKQYVLTIGRLDKNGKTFFKLKAREVKDGVKEVDLSLSLIF